MFVYSPKTFVTDNHKMLLWISTKYLLWTTIKICTYSRMRNKFPTQQTIQKQLQRSFMKLIEDMKIFIEI